jgi:hypothetical protein
MRLLDNVAAADFSTGHIWTPLPDLFSRMRRMAVQCTARAKLSRHNVFLPAAKSASGAVSQRIRFHEYDARSETFFCTQKKSYHLAAATTLPMSRALQRCVVSPCRLGRSPATRSTAGLFKQLHDAVQVLTPLFF